MRKFYIDLQPGVGYVVALLDTDGLDNGFLSNSYVRNFGFRQSDAIEFRNDCNDGKIDDSRIKLLIKTYTQQPYKYLGKGNLRKTHDND